jgi:hypothetical protein
MKGPWLGNIATFKEYRAHGGLIGFAPDPLTGHECGDSRYLAIPFLDACLATRLPDKGSKDQTLKPMATSNLGSRNCSATKRNQRRISRATRRKRSGCRMKR